MSHHSELVETAMEAIRAVADDLSAPNGQRLKDIKDLRDYCILEENRILRAPPGKPRAT